MNTIKKAIYLSAIGIICITAGCKKNSTCNGVPNVSVSAQIDVALPSYNAITVIGGAMVVTGGYDNIVIYHYLQDQFNAFDCCCPYDGPSNSKAIVVIQSNKLYVTCPVCGSSFMLSDGSVSKGPSTCPLKKYNTTYDGTSQLSITN